MTGGEARVGVVGLGNVLMGDDAVGPTLVRRLRAEFELPSEVTVLDLGTPGPDLVNHLRGLDALIVIDAVAAEAAPGEMRTYDRDAILEGGPSLRLTPHQPGLREALLGAELAGEAPLDVLLIGVVPERVGLGLGLGPAVQRALPRIERLVLAELQRLGVEPRRREEPALSEIWWESGVPGASS